VIYQRPAITDLGSITAHTYTAVTGAPKDLEGNRFDAGCELAGGSGEDECKLV
jgi:hypothetical protein